MNKILQKDADAAGFYRGRLVGSNADFEGRTDRNAGSNLCCRQKRRGEVVPRPLLMPGGLNPGTGYFLRVTWSQIAAPPPPIAAPMRAPFLPPIAAPTPAPTP